jgi:peptidoglycan/LPS O-acetylase OafA/YrhL
MKIEYRPDVDGLRALAVLAVILFHAFPKMLPGGFVGVDVFFVISGYLITQIILSDLEKQQFTLANFYGRRIRRIFPALILVLIASTAAAWHLIGPDELNSFFKNVFASALFSANLMLFSETGYFDVAAHAKPLLHLWSLGIEEQFYLAWPLVLMLTPRRILTQVICATLLASYALNIALLKDYPSAVFYLPFTRVWELAAGALVLKIPRLESRATDTLAFIGVVLIGVSFFAFSDKTPFPGFAATAPVSGTMLLLSCKESWLNNRIIANRAGVNVGLISYPLYLWHWPVLVFAPDHKFKALTDLEKGLAIGLTLALAFFTYKVIECPIRFAKRRFVVPPLVAAMAAIAVIGILPALGYTRKLPDGVAELLALPPAGEGMRVHECLLIDTDTNDFPPSCVDRARPLVAIWGDSTASALIPGFRKLQKSIPFGIVQFTVSSCSPILVPHAQLTKLCIERNQKIPQRISEASPDIVILEAVWDVHDKAETLRPTIEALQRAGIRRIIILGTVPVWHGGLPEVVTTYYVRTGGMIPERIDDYYDKHPSDTWMKPVAEELGLQFVSAWKPFCNEQGCLTRIGSSLVARDVIHLTPIGAEFLVKAIAPELGLSAQQTSFSIGNPVLTKENTPARY